MVRERTLPFPTAAPPHAAAPDTHPELAVTSPRPSAWHLIASTLAVVTAVSLGLGRSSRLWSARRTVNTNTQPRASFHGWGRSASSSSAFSSPFRLAPRAGMHRLVPAGAPHHALVSRGIPGTTGVSLLLALGVLAGTVRQVYARATRPPLSCSLKPLQPGVRAEEQGSAIDLFCAAAAIAEAEFKTHDTVPHEELGFEIVRKEFLKEYNSEAVLYRHKQTGAEVLSMMNNDENKVFGITFRTTPSDSTGLPHILEHSVLCGSRKYPVKEPFVELLKGSLNTFLNAMTYPDKTCYPVASTNLTDFYNLVDVYLDAVFHPNITPETLMQEGFHLEADKPDEDFTYKGVVFNEMKGVYSQPDSIHSRVCQMSLFVDPKVTYSVDSGGDPRVIPELTFEQYSRFHQHFYHPSNARIFFYGDDAPEKRLATLNEYLNEFGKNSYADHEVHYQPKFAEPRRVVDFYASSPDAEQGGKSYCSVNWVLNWQRLQPEEELALSLLNDMIIGSNAAPLYRALNESRLGSSVIGGGLDNTLLQTTFSVGMKDVQESDTAKLEQLILSTLTKIAEEGFTPEQIEASINSTEFAMRELNTGGFPRGIAIMLSALQHWLHDRDPIEVLKFEKPLAALKERLASGEDVFVPLVRKYLLDNTHRATVIVHPNPSLGEDLEKAEAEQLARIKEAMSPAEVETVIELKKKLQLKQETPDDPEALKCVPTLHVSDIPRENKTIPTAVSKVQEATLLSHDLFTNNILYLDMAFDLHTLPQDLVPFLPLFTRALSEFGTKKEDFVALTQRIKRKVGGISKSVMTSSVLHRPGEEAAHLIVRGKGTVDQLPEMADILTDILLQPQFNDQPKFRQMILESKASLEAAVVGSGHRVAAGRLAAMDNTSAYISEQMGGLSYLTFLKALLVQVDSDWPSVVATLERMRQLVVSRRNLVVNVTADDPLMNRFAPLLEDFVGRFPSTEPILHGWTGRLERANEAIVVPTQVNYVAKAANIYDAGYTFHGSSNVISKFLGTTWLWDRVRVVGGAYGAFCSFDRFNGAFSYCSYRDPNVLSTLEAYDGTPTFLHHLDLGEDALNKAIIGAIGDYDGYQLPDAKGYSAMTRFLLNVSDDDRQLTREQILSTTRKDFKEYADYLEAVKKKGTVVVVGSEADVTAADSKASLFGKRLNPLANDEQA